MRLFFLIALACLSFALPAKAAGNFSDWAAVIVAGDHRAHDGSDSEVFDDARHDIGEALKRIGFRAGNIAEFSVQPARYKSPVPQASDPHLISNALWDLADRTSAGCFVYLTSHGSTDGIVVGDSGISPAALAAMVDNSCAQRPTVVIVSACFSGVFVPALEGPNRLVLTAARADRTSFGCGQADRYTFFDQCFLESLRGTHDFPGLGVAIQSCVAAREKKDDVAPPSQPQLSIGSNVASNLPGW